MTEREIVDSIIEDMAFFAEEARRKTVGIKKVDYWLGMLREAKKGLEQRERREQSKWDAEAERAKEPT